MDILRGDIFFIKKGTGQVQGSEQDGDRPGIIVSNDIGNKFSPVVEVVYLTTQKKTSLPTHVRIKCAVMSTALCEQIDTVSKDRLDTYVRSCTQEEMAEIDKALKISIGIDYPIKNNTSNEAAQNVTNETNETNEQIEELKEKLEGAETKIDDLLNKLERFGKLWSAFADTNKGEDDGKRYA